MSTIRANTLVNMDGVTAVTLTGQVAAKSWVRYSTTGSSVTSSFNVSSVTKVATGAFSVTLTNALIDTNHSPISTTCRENAESDFRGAVVDLNGSFTTSSYRIATIYAGTTLADRTLTTVSVFR